jgi:hypothetical protein
MKKIFILSSAIMLFAVGCAHTRNESSKREISSIPVGDDYDFYTCGNRPR